MPSKTTKMTSDFTGGDGAKKWKKEQNMKKNGSLLTFYSSML